MIATEIFMILIFVMFVAWIFGFVALSNNWEIAGEIALVVTIATGVAAIVLLMVITLQFLNAHLF